MAALLRSDLHLTVCSACRHRHKADLRCRPWLHSDRLGIREGCAEATNACKICKRLRTVIMVSVPAFDSSKLSLADDTLLAGQTVP